MSTSEPPDPQIVAGFDRVMGFWKSAHDAALEAERAFVEMKWAPTFRQESQRMRRAVVLSAVITLAMSLFDLRPTKVEALGLTLDGAKSLVLIGGGVAFTSYFLSEFLAFAARDFRYWRQRLSIAHRELMDALDLDQRQARESFGNSSFADEIKQSVSAKQAEYSEKPSFQPSSRLEPFWGVGPMAWVEHRVPILVSVSAVLVGAAKVVGEWWC